ATLRPEQAPAEWMRREYVSQVALDRLDRKETIEMVLAVTGGKPLPAMVLEEIVTRTDGVPLFIEDLTRMVIESDIVVERRRYHEKIAELLEQDAEATQTQPELIAYHFSEAGMSMKAARCWGRAAWRALECFANREALQHVRRGLEALEALPADDARADVE